MTRWSPASLKLTIPTLIVVFSGFVLAAFYSYSLPRSLLLIEDEGKDRLFQRLSHLQGTLEHLIRHDDSAGLQREIAALASQEEYKSVVLANDKGTVIASNRRAWLGKPVTEVFPQFDIEQAETAVRERSAHVLVTEDGAALDGYAGIAMAPSHTALRLDRFGQLYIHYDLLSAKNKVYRWVLQQLFFWGLMVSVLALLLWLAFHIVLTRRADMLIGVAERLADGDLSARSNLTGRDELARLSRALDVMASRISQAQQDLARDIAKREKAELAVRESEALKSAIIDNALLGVVSMDDKGRIVDFNPAAEVMFGYSRDEVQGRELAGKIIPERFREPHREGLQRYQKTSGSKILGQRMETTAVRSDGREFPVEMSISAACFGGQNYFTAFIADLTEKKLSETALRASEEQYRTIFSVSSDGLALWRDDGTLVDMNPTFCAMHGYTREEFPKLSPADFVATESLDVYERFTAALRSGEEFHAEGRGRRKDGSEMDLDVRATPMMYRGRRHQLTVVRDITDTKRAERERRKLEGQLRQSQKMEAIGHLTGGIAHDFNNLLTSIMGFCMLGMERLKPGSDEKLAKYLGQIQKSGEKARDLIKQMLTFSRGQRGEPRPLSLAPLVNESCKLMRSTIPSSVEFRTDLQNDLPPVMLDPVHVEQVMMNLCINARDAMGNRGVLSVSVRLADIPDAECASCRQHFGGRYVELVVRDTGSGMPPENLDHIFEPFFTTKEVGKGTGMGLPTVHGIVHEHGGHIRVDTRPGNGSSFGVLFPTLSVTAADDGAERDQEQIADRSRLHAHVLIVDDEDSVVELMRDLLQSRGLRVTAKTDSAEALNEVRQRPRTFDLVITDQTMPKQTGIELAVAIREINPELPVILYSGYSEQVSEGELDESGVRAFLKKPLDIEDLFAVMVEILPDKKMIEG